MFVVKYLMGRERLWKVFWFGGGLAGAIFWILVTLSMGAGAIPPGAGLALFILYELWISISIWTCAANVENPLWGYLARAVAVFGLIGIAFQLYQVSQLD